MKFNPRKITTSVGYSFAIAALCSLAIAPQAALADDGVGEEADSGSSASASTGKRVYSAPVASEKSETVYLFANPDGSVKNTEVSEALKNPLGENELADSSILTDIENAEDDATYNGSGDDMVWSTSGKDVYYTGATTKEAPVSVKVSYFLDDKEIAYKDLAGASGKLKVRYDYANNATVQADINGNSETLNVPFTFITALLFDNDSFRNAEVTNGKIIDDGDRTIIAGYAVPGLQKSLGELAEDFDIPEYFEVTADVTDFEMKTSLTIATAGLLEGFDTDDIDMGDLEDASDKLTEAMGEILDGTGSLKDGLDKLANGAGQLADGTGKLADGIGTKNDTAEDKTLLGGMNSLKKGYDEELYSPIKDSVTKVKTFIEENRTNLTVAWEALQGMDKAIDALGKSIDALGNVDKKDLSELADKLDALQANLDSAQSEIEKAESMVAAFSNLDLSSVEGDLGSVGANMSAAGNSLQEAGAILQGDVSADLQSVAQDAQSAGSHLSNVQSILQGVNLDALGLTKEQKDAINGALSSVSSELSSAGQSLGAIETDLSGAKDDLSNLGGKIQDAGGAIAAGGESLKSVASTLQSLKSNLPSESEIKEIKSLLDQAQGALTDENIAIMDQCISSLSDAMEKLDVEELNGEIKLLKKYYPQIVKYLESTSAQEAMEELETKLDKTVEGMGQVSKGLESEQKGLEQLAEGASKLESGSDALAEGADAAASGSDKLLDGLQTFDDEGISKITDLIDNDLVSLKDRLQALGDAAKAYDNFAGITEGTTGSVKFVIETDPITLDE